MQIQNLEFDQMTGALLKDPKYCQMKQYIQHGRCSTYDHCIAVAKLCFLWGRKLPIEVKEKEMLCFMIIISMTGTTTTENDMDFAMRKLRRKMRPETFHLAN